MILITPEETSSPLNEDIEKLQTNLRGFARDIENLQVNWFWNLVKKMQTSMERSAPHVWVRLHQR